MTSPLVLDQPTALDQPRVPPPAGRRVAVVGAGSVGATIAYACLLRGVATSLVLHDADADRVRAQVLDLEQGTQFVPVATVQGSDDVAVTAGADVVVITAGVRQRPGQTRHELAAANVEMCRTMVPALVEQSPDAVFLVVTNPVDVLTRAVLTFSGLPAHRVLGSGTVLDSSRLRVLLARHCGVAVGSVHALVVGEHGDSELALWSRASIGPVPLAQWSVPGREPVGPAVRAALAAEVVSAAEVIIRGKGATSFAIGLATARILESVLHDEGSVLPVSTLLDGSYGLYDVCLSLPTVLTRRGAGPVLAPSLSLDEVAALHRSAAAVRAVGRSCGL